MTRRQLFARLVGAVAALVTCGVLPWHRLQYFKVGDPVPTWIQRVNKGRFVWLAPASAWRAFGETHVMPSVETEYVIDCISDAGVIVWRGDGDAKGLILSGAPTCWHRPNEWRCDPWSDYGSIIEANDIHDEGLA